MRNYLEDLLNQELDKSDYFVSAGYPVPESVSNEIAKLTREILAVAA